MTNDERRHYIFHEGSGTVIAMDECVIVQMDDETADAVADGEQPAPRGSKITDPYRAIWFDAGALRDHYEDDPDIIADLTDKDLDEAGEWAMNDENIWGHVYDAWDYGIIQVRNERAEGRDGPE